MSLQGFSPEDQQRINQLFRECIKPERTTHDVQSIILAHQHFVSSEMFLVGIVWNFHSVDDIAQFRILNVLKKWIELARPSFQSNKPLGRITRSFHEFLNNYKPELVKFLQSSLEKGTASDPNQSMHQPEYLVQYDSMWNLPTPVLLPIIEDISQLPFTNVNKKLPYYFPLSAFAHQTVATVLTLRDYVLLLNIDTTEMLKTRWTLPNQAPTLKACSDRIDRLCCWVTYQIIGCPVPKFRVKIFDFFVKVCERLIELNSFNSLFAIYFGLGKLSEYGLACVSEKSKHPDIWKKIKDLCDYNHNFFGYRSLLKSASYPMIEFQELILKDLLLLSEGILCFFFFFCLLSLRFLSP